MAKKTDTDCSDEPQSLEARMDRIEASLKELKQLASLAVVVDPNRAYKDGEVCTLLGVSRQTLWRIRKGGKLARTELMPGVAARTDGRTIIAFMDERERESNPLEFTGTGRRRKRL